jgi:muramidase (phage lysozyme)
MEKLYNAQLKYTLAMAKGQKGASQFNDGIDAMTEATQIAAVALSLLVPGGALVKGVVAGLTFLGTQALKTAAEMQKAANDQADATYKAFQAFSKAGATGADGLKGFFDDVNRMRLNVNQLDSMATVIGNSAKDMASMGGTVNKARGQFANLVQGMGDFETGMLNLGMSYDDQAEAAMGYMKLQNTLSQGQQRDYGKLSGGMKKYLEETEALARVTGLNRKEQEAAQEKMLSQQRFGAKIQELRDEGTVESNRAADLLIAGLKRAAAQGDMAAQAYADQTTGMLTSDAAIKGNMSTQGKQLEQINDILEGRITNEDQLNVSQQELLATTKEVGKTFNKTFQAGVGEDFLLPFAEFQKTAKLANQNFAEQMVDATEEVKKLINSTEEVDNQLKRYNALIKGQNDEMLALQRSMNGAFSSAGVGVQGFTDILVKAGDMIFEVAKKALEMLGLMDAGKEREERLGKELADSEMAGAAGEVGAAAAQGAEAMTSAPKAEDIRSAKDLGFIDRMFVGEENVKKRIELENKGMTPAQAAEEVAKSQGRIPTTATNKNLEATSSAAQYSPSPVTTLVTGAAKTAAPAAPAAAPASSGGKGGAAPAVTGPPTSFSVDKLLNYIGMKEARGQYNMLVGGKTKSDLTTMSVADVQKFQNTMIKNGHETTAVGKYQMLYDTLAGLVRNGVLKPGDIFNSSTQDRAAIALLKEKGMDSYVSGKLSKEEFADRVARVWASMPLGSGRGAYDGVGSNKAIGSRADYLAAFARDGGIFDGPKSGYAATLHGHEAVIPLKDGAVPVSMSQEFNMTATNLGELVNQMRSNMAMQASMLAVMEDIRRSQSTTADNTGRMAAYASN